MSNNTLNFIAMQKKKKNAKQTQTISKKKKKKEYGLILEWHYLDQNLIFSQILCRRQMLSNKV